MPLPLAALRFAPATVASLARVGLKRIGDIVDLPRAPLTARFGADTAAPARPRAGPRARAAQSAPAGRALCRRAALSRADRARGRRARHGREAGGAAAVALERRGDGARRIELTLFRTDGALRRIAVGCSRPLRDPARHPRAVCRTAERAGRRVRSRLRLRHGAAVGGGGRAAPPEQIGIGGEEDAGELVRLVDRLSARLGAQPRAAADRAGQPYPGTRRRDACRRRRLRTDHGWDAFRRHRAEAELAPRPLRLLTRPEPIEAWRKCRTARPCASNGGARCTM